MTTREIRALYATRLATVILQDPEEFYRAFDEMSLVDWLTFQWETVCDEQRVSLSDHTFFPETDAWVLEESEEGVAYMVAAELPRLAEEPDNCLYAVVFGSNMDPRVFTASCTTGTVSLTEWIRERDTVSPVAVGTPFADDRSRLQTMAREVYAVCDAYRE